MSDESTKNDDGLEREFADVLDVLRRFEPAPAAEGLERRVEERVTMGLEQKPVELAVSVAARDVAGISLRCTFCHAALTRGEASFCAGCLAPHHDECWVDHGRCAAPGCAETRVVRPREASAPRGRYRGSRRWSRLAVVTAGLMGVVGFGVTMQSWRVDRQRAEVARDEKAMVDEFKRLKAEGLRAFDDFNRVEKPRSAAEERAAWAAAHTPLVKAMDLITKLLGEHRGADGHTPNDFEGYEVDLSEIAEILVDLEKREPAARNPRKAEVARLLAESRQAALEGRVVESTRLLRQAVELDPTNADARELLAKLAPLADGVERVNENLARDPSVLAIEARLLLREGRLDEAMSRATRAIELDPLNALAYLVRAEVLVAKDRLQEAIDDLSKSIELDPTQSGPFRVRGRAMVSLGQLDQGLKDLATACRMSPVDPGTVSDFTRVIELDPKRDDAWFLRGWALAQVGDFAGARADLDRAIMLNDGVAEYYRERGLIRSELGDPEGAQADAAYAEILEPSAGGGPEERGSRVRPR